MLSRFVWAEELFCRLASISLVLLLLRADRENVADFRNTGERARVFWTVFHVLGTTLASLLANWFRSRSLFEGTSMSRLSCILLSILPKRGSSSDGGPGPNELLVSMVTFAELAGTFPMLVCFPIEGLTGTMFLMVFCSTPFLFLELFSLQMCSRRYMRPAMKTTMKMAPKINGKILTDDPVNEWKCLLLLG